MMFDLYIIALTVFSPKAYRNAKWGRAEQVGNLQTSKLK